MSLPAKIILKHGIMKFNDPIEASSIQCTLPMNKGKMKYIRF